MDGQEIIAPAESCEVYIERDVSPLKIYIPRSEEAQDLCIQHSLPEKLVEWMMVDPIYTNKAVRKGGPVGSDGMAEIGTEDIEMALHDDQEENPVPADEQDVSMENHETVEEDQASPEEDNLDMANPANAEEGMDQEPAKERNPTEESHDSADNHQSPGGDQDLIMVGYDSHDEGLDADMAENNRETYRRYLERIRMAARNCVFPTNKDDTVRSNNNGEEVGASRAILLPPQSPGLGDILGRDQISATITYLMNDETDGSLEYGDLDRSFTALLIERGYLEPGLWEGRKPKYFFGVDATARGFKHPFHVTGVQYETMKMHSSDDSIYILFRLFNMLDDTIDVKVYVNPIQLDRDGVLKFSADDYLVTPLQLDGSMGRHGLVANNEEVE
ncbi:hypothetical protein B0H63DRAFT_542160 [Podospora didyma]|uniref:Uncharacterized protein n=1 Tax=Podospora didyma TaxID=330526 RepID=A0AAE0NUH8_9PEZI|nr:hypothetical protein B0H63DRAFT_542160 [Podospora didyma]